MHRSEIESQECPSVVCEIGLEPALVWVWVGQKRRSARRRIKRIASAGIGTTAIPISGGPKSVERLEVVYGAKGISGPDRRTIGAHGLRWRGHLLLRRCGRCHQGKNDGSTESPQSHPCSLIRRTNYNSFRKPRIRFRCPRRRPGQAIKRSGESVFCSEGRSTGVLAKISNSSHGVSS